MEKRERTIYEYIANDGSIFSTKEDCLNYEEGVQELPRLLKEQGKFKLFDNDGNELDVENIDSLAGAFAVWIADDDTCRIACNLRDAGFYKWAKFKFLDTGLNFYYQNDTYPIFDDYSCLNTYNFTQILRDIICEQEIEINSNKELLNKVTSISNKVSRKEE